MKQLSTSLLCAFLLIASVPVGAQEKQRLNKAGQNNQTAQNGKLNGDTAVRSSLPETTMDQLAAQEEKKTIFDDPLQGVIVNRTVTVLGNDFYQYFTTYWNQVNQESRYSIAIYERPTARWGSEIWIEFRHQRIFHTFLAPARQAAKDIAEAAADIVEQNIVQAEHIRLNIIEQDLGPEEL